MTDLRKAAEMALERLESHEYWMDEEAIQALRQALAQPVDAVNMSQERVDETAKCKREWVGLTDEERADCWSSSAVQSAINIEAKLKEKNSG